jgi:hypothetical protein
MKILRDGRPMDLKVTPEAGAVFSGAFEPPDVRVGPMSRYGGPQFRFEGHDREWLPENWPGRRRGRTQTRLGVGVQGLTRQLAEYFGTKNGVLVTTVREGSPAAAAGLKAGDVITAAEGKSVSSPSDLADSIRDSEAEELKISYVRDRKAADARVKVPARQRPGRSARPA